jgi:hypothetical protein
MIKRMVIFTVALIITAASFAQDEKEEGDSYKGFKPEYLFTGGNIDLGFYNGGTILGATPQFGYSISNWLDAGVIFGYTYSSQRYNDGSKLRQTIIGPGAFARIFPIGGFFITGQFEHNFIRLKNIYIGGTEVANVDANSLLVGAGYASGKEGRNSPYYFFSVSFDILKNPYSPYVNQFGDVNPVINAGFNIPLFQGRGRRR